MPSTEPRRPVEIEMQILDRRVGTEFPLPARGSPGAAAMDLVACLDAEVQVAPDQVVQIRTGIAIHIADPTLVGIVAPRSGISVRRGLVPANLVGVIDSDYQGELLIFLWNRGTTTQTVSPGERIAQLLLVPCVPFALKETSTFATTARGKGGFGSTGRF